MGTEHDRNAAAGRPDDDVLFTLRGVPVSPGRRVRLTFR
jgi:hypothetical protein